MRTRVYNKMTGREVEGYLTRGGCHGSARCHAH